MFSKALNIDANKGNLLRAMVPLIWSRLVYSRGMQGLAPTLALNLYFMKKSKVVQKLIFCVNYSSAIALFIIVKLDPACYSSHILLEL